MPVLSNLASLCSRAVIFSFEIKLQFPLPEFLHTAVGPSSSRGYPSEGHMVAGTH